MKKKLHRSYSSRMICGVCGGIGEHFGIDPTIIRLMWALFCLLGGAGVVFYIIAAIVIPTEG